VPDGRDHEVRRAGPGYRHTMSTIDYPGHSSAMPEQPADEMRDYVGRGLLSGRRALIAGGDSGIGRAVAAAFAKEGADVAIAYLSEHDDAAHTVDLIKREEARSPCPVISPRPATAGAW
jgi:hypothetical protein